MTNRGLERRNIFREPRDAARFLALLGETSNRFDLEVHAYCLMTNHYHLLVRTPLGNLSEAMRHLDGVYTQRFNRSHGRDGPLFRGRFACVLVQADRHLVCAARYIHLNPVEAGLVEQPEEWTLSSYAAYLDPRHAPPWLRTSFVLGWFGSTGARIRHREFVEEGMDATTRAFFDRKRRAPVLGTRSYRTEVAAKIEDQPEDTLSEMPEAARLGARPSLDAIGRATAATLGIERAQLRSKRRGNGKTFGLARGAFVDVAVRVFGHTPRTVARWLGYGRINSAAEAARRFRSTHPTPKDVRRDITALVATGAVDWTDTDDLDEDRVDS